MAYCVKCGTQLSDGAKFCPKCGTPVTTTQANNDSIESSLIYSIELISTGPAILQVTKILMDLLGVEMREAKDIINSSPSTLVTGISHSRAKEIAQMLQNVGAEIEIKHSNKTNKVDITLRNVDINDNKPILDKQPVQYNDSLIEESSKNTWLLAGVCVICVLVLYFLLGKCDSNGSKDKGSSDLYSPPQPEQIEKHDFFEPGNTYYADYSVRRQQGFGGDVVHRQYLLKIYNDDTKEMTFDYGTTKKTAECKIRKKSVSKRDISATWYEIEWEHSYTLGGKYVTGVERVIVDEEGNIYEFYVSDDTCKEIQEAIASGTCRFGKFRKETLSKKIYSCRTCGIEYDPGREPIYSEEYCWKDYPLTCSRCGKSYTIRLERQEGLSASNDLCGRCYEKWQSSKIVEHALSGR